MSSPSYLCCLRTPTTRTAMEVNVSETSASLAKSASTPRPHVMDAQHRFPGHRVIFPAFGASIALALSQSHHRPHPT